MKTDQPDFQSLKNINDNALLLSIANEYISENVYLKKIGTDIKKNLAVLKDDIIALKKQFPGKFTQEVNTDGIISSFEATALEMLSDNDVLKKNCISGKLGATLNTDMIKITEAIEKIWHQVKGGDVKYTATDSISVFFGRLNFFSGIVRLVLGVFKILFILLIISLAGFSYLYFTMEKEGPILEEIKKITALLEEKKADIIDLEKNKSEAQISLKTHENGKLEERQDKIAIINIETQIQGLNQEIHMAEGQIITYKRTLEENKEKLEILKRKSFLDRLLKF
jgi:hypothetical protein